jgi:hypothetical protein
MVLEPRDDAHTIGEGIACREFETIPLTPLCIIANSIDKKDQSGRR